MDSELDLNVKEIGKLGTYVNESAQLKYTLSLVESKCGMQSLLDLDMKFRIQVPIEFEGRVES